MALLDQAQQLATFGTKPNGKTAIHSGNLGDIVYALPTCEALGVDHLILNAFVDPVDVKRKLTSQAAVSLAEYLVELPWLQQVSVVALGTPADRLEEDVIGVDFNLDRFRRNLAEPNLHLIFRHALPFSTWVVANDSWLVTPKQSKEPEFQAKSPYIAVSLTGRYRRFEEDYYGKLLGDVPEDRVFFIGFPQDQIERRGIPGQVAQFSSTRELVSFLAGAELFIGNPSFPYSLAEGLKTPRLIEVPKNGNAYPLGTGGESLHLLDPNLIRQKIGDALGITLPKIDATDKTVALLQKQKGDLRNQLSESRMELKKTKNVIHSLEQQLLENQETTTEKEELESQVEELENRLSTMQLMLSNQSTTLRKEVQHLQAYSQQVTDRSTQRIEATERTSHQFLDRWKRTRDALRTTHQDLLKAHRMLGESIDKQYEIRLKNHKQSADVADSLKKAHDDLTATAEASRKVDGRLESSIRTLNKWHSKLQAKPQPQPVEYSFSPSDREIEDLLELPPEHVGNSVGHLPGLRATGKLTPAHETPSSIRGWVYDPLNAAESLDLEFFCDGKQISATKADLRIPTLAEHHGSDGFHGFVFVPPESFFDGNTHTITIVDPRDGCPVFDPLERVFVLNRDFRVYPEFLSWSFLNRTLELPFTSSDKAVFAFMETRRKQLVSQASAMAKGTAPRISIIMPCHNREDLVGRAIESILSQSMDSWELVVVDDGSSDGSVNKIQEFTDRDPRIQLIQLDENEGVSAARNHGLEASSAPLIAYLDTDNTWHRDHLACCQAASENHPSAPSFYTGQFLFRRLSDEQPYAMRFGPFHRALLENRNYIDLNCFFHTREIYLKQGGFDEELKKLVDWDLTLRYTEKLEAVPVPVATSYYYFNHDLENITTGGSGANGLKPLRDNLERGRLSVRTIGEDDSRSLALRRLVQPESLRALSSKVSIVIPSYGIPETLELAVQLLLETTPSDKVEVIIVDNGSDAETLSTLGRIETEAEGRVRTCVFGKNHGFTYAINRGIEMAGTNDVVIYNNDALATEGWLEALQEAAYEWPEAGLVAPRQVLCAGTKTMKVHMPYCDEAYEIDVTCSHHHKNLVAGSLVDPTGPVELTFAPFFCVYASRQVLDTVGSLESEFARHYRSDRLYCDSVRAAGLKVYYQPKSKVYHLLQQATSAMKQGDEESYRKIFVENGWSIDEMKEQNYEQAVWDTEA